MRECYHVLARGGAMGAGGIGGELIGLGEIGPSIAIEPTVPAGKGPAGIVPAAACKFDAITDSAYPNNGAIWMDPGVCAMYVLIEVKMVRTCIVLHCLHFFFIAIWMNYIILLTLEELARVVLVVAVVVVALVCDGIMVYGDDNRDVCDGHALRVEYTRLVDEHESKRQHHQMATVHPTMCTWKLRFKKQ